jgi:hypothetical protein
MFVSRIVLLGIDAEHRELVDVPTAHDVQAETAAADVVRRNDLLRGEHRMQQRRVNGSENTHALRCRQQPRCPRQRFVRRAFKIGFSTVAFPASDRKQEIQAGLVGEFGHTEVVFPIPRPAPRNERRRAPRGAIRAEQTQFELVAVIHRQTVSSTNRARYHRSGLVPVHLGILQWMPSRTPIIEELVSVFSLRREPHMHRRNALSLVASAVGATLIASSPRRASCQTPLEKIRIAGPLTEDSPQMDESIGAGTSKTLGDAYGAIAPVFMIAAYIARSDWAATHADTLRRFNTVNAQATTYVNTHALQTAPLVTELTKITLDVDKMHRTLTATSVDPRIIQALIDGSAKYEITTKAFPAREIIWANS